MSTMPGYGDEATWGACAGHPHDPRSADVDELGSEEAAEAEAEIDLEPEIEFYDVPF